MFSESGQPARSFWSVANFDAVSAILGSTAISTAGGLIGSSKQASTVSDASDAAQAALAQQRSDLTPWRTTGGTALGLSADLLGVNGTDAANAAMSNFTASPGYQYQLTQGLRGVDAGAASQGMLRSGATLKAEQKYGSDLANQDFTNYYNRLAGISTLGENAAAGGASTAQTSASDYLNSANATSSIYSKEAQGLTSNVNTLLNNTDFQKWYSGLGKTTPNTTTTTANDGNYLSGFQAYYPVATVR